MNYPHLKERVFLMQMDKTNENIVQEIIKQNIRLVMYIAGGGADAIGEITRYGGASKILLEAVVPYSKKSFDSLIKTDLDKYVNSNAAIFLAQSAFQRAVFLANTPEKCIGIGVTASLAKENQRDVRSIMHFCANMQLMGIQLKNVFLIQTRRDWIRRNHLLNQF